ncbi:two-CW domain-containing protein [Candidatus Omnitrophota bacterium]
MIRENCWEVMKCGRESGGAKANELGVCSATLNTTADGIHGGKNGGRVCWAITGTLCEGKVQGIFADKLHNCKTCKFYEIVSKDEGENFLGPADIIRKLSGL